MRVFITGGTGFIGEATILELVAAGHSVLGLARNSNSAAHLSRLGADPYSGDLGDTDRLAAAARQCDAVIHLAFDNKDLHGWAEKDRAVVQTFAESLAGTGKALVVTSVVAIVEPGTLATEAQLPSRDSIGAFRAGSEDVARHAAADGVRSSIIRLPPTVHGEGDRMFVPHLVATARRTGVSAFVAEGENRWPAVHRLDAARLYRLAAEAGESGDCYHAVAEGGLPFRAIAQAIGAGLDLPLVSMSPEDAHDHFGWLARFVQMDLRASSKLTQAKLNWHPRETDLLSDIGHGSYFDNETAAYTT